MFTYSTKIRLRDTDATGVLYFADQFKIALEAFEEYLEQFGYSLNELIHNSDYLLPIVHAEGDYFAPLLVGSCIEVVLQVAKIGNTSFTLGYTFFDRETQQEVGKVTIVHVCVTKQMRTSHPIPEHLLELLRKIKTV